MSRESKKLQPEAPYELYSETRKEYGWDYKEGYEHKQAYDIFNKGYAAAKKEDKDGRD
jgi:hypothetical protein